MKYTEHYKLKKPDADDFYNVKDFNENADKVDSILHIETGNSTFPIVNGSFLNINGTLHYRKYADGFIVHMIKIPKNCLDLADTMIKLPFPMESWYFSVNPQAGADPSKYVINKDFGNQEFGIGFYGTGTPMEVDLFVVGYVKDE